MSLREVAENERVDLRELFRPGSRFDRLSRPRRVSFRASPPDSRLARADLVPIYLRHGVLPHRRSGDGIVLAATRYGAALAAIPKFRGGHAVREIVLCSDAEMDDYSTRAFAPALTDHATQALRRADPCASARTPMPLWLQALLVLVPLASAIAFWRMGSAAIYAICLVFLPYCITAAVLRSILLFTALTRAQPPVPIPAREPPVSILVPIYREAGSLPILIDALARLDYPHDRLEVLLLVEADDAETVSAVATLALPSFIRVVHIPPSMPRTKPKALNVALPMVRGEIVGIFDAEDCPEPDQIRKAVAALLQGGPDVACAQARLNHYNARENWITRCAAMEYALWFDLMLKGLGALRLPVPLGGTSLYIRTPVLRLVGAWDPDNVTEDADLGLRLARRGWRTVVFDSTTHEEATTSPRRWIRQRSRWIKGFLLTWAVHMRAPLALLRDLGLRGFLAVNAMLFDGFMAFFAQPFFIAMLVLPLFGLSPLPSWLEGPVGTGAFVLFAAAQLPLFAAAALATKRRFGWGMLPWVPTLWFYWAMGGIAAIRAGLQLFTHPQYWEKTEHCISEVALDRRRAIVGGNPMGT